MIPMVIGTELRLVIGGFYAIQIFKSPVSISK